MSILGFGEITVYIEYPEDWESDMYESTLAYILLVRSILN